MKSSASATNVIPEKSLDEFSVERKKEKDERTLLVNKNITVFGSPIRLTISSEMTNIIEQEQVIEKILQAMILDGMNQSYTVDYLREISYIAKEYIVSQLIIDKKTLSPEIFSMMFSVLEHPITSHQKRKISYIIQKIYSYIIQKYRNSLNNIQLGLYKNNPSIIAKYQYQEFGAGSYDEDGKWTYGKQNIPSLTTGRAIADSRIIHPIYGFVFSFFNIQNSDYNVLSFSEKNEEKFYVNNRGFFSHGEKERLQKFVRLHISQNISWSRQTNDDIYVVSGKVDLLDQENRFFKITATYFDSILTIDYYIDSGKKFSETKILVDNIRPSSQVYRRSIQFLSKFIASEFAAYVFAAKNNMMVPAMTQVVPNGNPQTALRNGGGVVSAPVVGTGQSAMPISVVRSAAHPAVDFHGMEGMYLHDRNIVLAKPLQKRPLFWNMFSNQILIDAHEPESANLSHLSSNFMIIAQKTKMRGKTKILAVNENRDITEELLVVHQGDFTHIDIGKVALGHLLDIRHTPEWSEFSALLTDVPYSISEKISHLEQDVIANLENTDITHEFVKYSINSSSLTLEKFPRVMTVHGNLTNTVKIFAHTIVDTFENANIISSYDEINHQIMLSARSGNNEEYNSSVYRYYSPEGISKSLYMLKNILEKFSLPEIPMLPNVNMVGTKQGDQKQSVFHYDLPIVEEQNNGLCYVIRLSAEHVPEEKDNGAKAKSSVKIENEEMEITHFSKFYQFKIMCNDSHGETLFVYDATRNFSSDHLPILSTLGLIYSGYLPDFIAWVNTRGMNFYRAFVSQNVQDAEAKDFSQEEASPIPFYFDNTLCTTQGHVARKWMTGTFPSVLDVNLNVSKGQYSILQHLLDSTASVDTIRKDGYSPALELNDSKNCKMLRAVMLFHDIGKISILDGGRGPFSENHGKVSASIARKFLEKFQFLESDIEQITKFIAHHDVFKNALEGKLGHLDEALSHIGRIAKTPSDIRMFYHIYRCDNDSFPEYIEDTEGEKVSSKIFITAEELCEHLVRNTKLAQYSPIKDSALHIPASKFLFPDSLKEVGNSESEFVIKTNNFLSSSVIRQESIRTNSYNPEYFHKMQHMIKEMQLNPDLSFARSLGMSYDGATGSVVRCFLWTDVSVLNSIFAFGLKKYAGSENRLIEAVINSPSPGHKTTTALFRDKDHPKLSAEAKAIIAFDYHVGNPIYHEELLAVRQLVRSWKISKMGRQLFSMNFDRYDIADQSSIALSLGYSSIVRRIFTSLNDPMPSISCLDPNRIALLTAYVLPRGIHVGSSINEIGQTHNSYAAYPAKIEVSGKNGNRSLVTLPALPFGELFLSPDHTHFCVIQSGDPQVLKSKKIGSGFGSPLIGEKGLWRGLPKISSGRI